MKAEFSDKTVNAVLSLQGQQPASEMRQLLARVGRQFDRPGAQDVQADREFLAKHKDDDQVIAAWEALERECKKMRDGGCSAAAMAEALEALSARVEPPDHSWA